MKAVYPKMQSSHLIKQEKFYIITTLLLQCFQLLEINHASFTKVKAKAESEIWFSSWVSEFYQTAFAMVNQETAHKKSDNVTSWEATVSFHTLQKYQTIKSFSRPFSVSSSSLPPEHHSLVSFLYLLPCRPPSPSLLHISDIYFLIWSCRGGPFQLALSFIFHYFFTFAVFFFLCFRLLPSSVIKKYILNEITISFMLQNLQIYLELNEANVTNKVQRKILSLWLDLQIRKKNTGSIYAKEIRDRNKSGWS